MKALRLEEPGRLSGTIAAEPEGPAAGQALVQVHRVGVCGTDVHAFAGRQPFFTYPRILGHELGVEVLAVGEGVSGIRAGDHCAVEPYMECGACIACRRGKPNCCVAMSVLGVHADGGMRERFLVPARKLHPSASLSFDQLALVEPLGIGAHAVARAGIEPGESVLVVGAGPIGLAVTQFAVDAGANVAVLDVNAARLAFCREKFGIALTIHGAEEDPVQALEAWTHGDLPTAVLDATGSQRAMNAAFEYPAHGGRLVFVGLFVGDVTFHDPSFHRRELTVMASRNALAADFRRIISRMEDGHVDTSPWITHRAPLDAVPDVFGSWTKPEAGVLKALIDIVP